MDFAEPVLDWYDTAARDLPWRRPGVGGWAVLVSEVMLQQTPVHRVLPVYAQWLDRWPTPAALAAEPAGEVVRAWGRLGYPRRALRLHASAQLLVERFGGDVPSDVAALESLPGIGSYTARAVASFAFGRRHPVVDTNVRRVVARAVQGVAEPGAPSARRDEAAIAALLPDEPARAARFGVAVMELGALVCTARSPACAACPLLERCAWNLTGRPPAPAPRVRAPQFAGSDRQVRGLLMAVLRAAPTTVAQAELDAVWPDAAQRTRALASLVADGLVEARQDGRFALPA
jgi:A/G-specific adenine glycosylase